MRNIFLCAIPLLFLACVSNPKKTQLASAPAPAKKLFANAQSQFQKGNLDSSATIAKKIVASYRQTDTGDDALFLLAKVYSRQEQWKKAFNVYESVYSSSIYSPREFLASTAAAKILAFKVARPKKAVTLVDKSLRLRPNAAQRVSLLEVKYGALSKSGSQLEAFETLVELSRMHPNAAKRAVSYTHLTLPTKA